MKVYRYNCKNREQRRFNNCGKEKNPNMVKYYATNLKYAENYKYIYDKRGYIIDECTLEITDIDDNIKLFDMEKNYNTLNTYKMYVNNIIQRQLNAYIKFLNESKTKKDKKLWTSAIEKLKNEENNIIINLKANEFQQLADFEMQNFLICELKALGYDGYFTKNEIAIF